MAFRPGRPQADEFENSMAAKMEQAFLQAWDETHDSELPETNRQERRVLFVAIAQGVIGYMQEHADEGFDVAADAVQTDDDTIRSEGEIDIPGIGGTVSVVVDQQAGADNRVHSTIERTDGEISINADGVYDRLSS